MKKYCPDTFQENDTVTAAARDLIAEAYSKQAQAAVRWYYRAQAAYGICMTNDEADDASRADGELARAMDGDTLSPENFALLLKHCQEEGLLEEIAEEPEPRPDALAVTMFRALLKLQGSPNDPRAHRTALNAISVGIGAGLNNAEGTDKPEPSDLEKFALEVLAILEEYHEWGSATLGDIGNAAIEAGFGEEGEDQQFTLTEKGKGK